MNKIRIKVCGMTDPSNVEVICKFKPEYLGYIFYPKSARYVGNNPDPRIFSIVPESIEKTAVFVNEYYERMIEIVEKFDINTVQLHGMESPEICKSFRFRGKKVIKVIPGNQIGNDNLLKDYSDVVDYFLFDTPVKSFGGSGRKFNWSNLDELNTDIKFFLSGGISIGDAAQLKKIESSTFYAADINSRFESAPGMKNPELVKKFINELRHER
ncbi:phosphoribosylanthranilate isomerase [Bacteroidota bacterium]